MGEDSWHVNVSILKTHVVATSRCTKVTSHKTQMNECQVFCSILYKHNTHTHIKEKHNNREREGFITWKIILSYTVILNMTFSQNNSDDDLTKNGNIRLAVTYKHNKLPHVSATFNTDEMIFLDDFIFDFLSSSS